MVKAGLCAKSKMAAAAILNFTKKVYNSAIYCPISMKFETQHKEIILY